MSRSPRPIAQRAQPSAASLEGFGDLNPVLARLYAMRNGIFQ